MSPTPPRPHRPIARSPGPARSLRDPQELKALTHPTRLALLDVLGIEGPMTATEAAALVGESPSSCSFHLRELARRGFVEEAGTGHGRQRPWRLVTMGSSIQTTDLRGDAEAVGENVLDLWHNRALVRLRHWLEHRRSASRSLRAASSFNSTVAWATPAEMKKLNQTIAAVMDPYRDRAYDPELRPAAAQPFELLYFSYPIADQIELMRQPKRPKDP